MRDEIVGALAESLRENGFEIFHNGGSSLSVNPYEKKYISIIVWYNPELAVSIHENGCGKHLGYITLCDPESFEQIVKILHKSLKEIQ